MSVRALAKRYGGRRTHVRVTIEIWRDGQRVLHTTIGHSPNEDRDNDIEGKEVIPSWTSSRQ